MDVEDMIQENPELRDVFLLGSGSFITQSELNQFFYSEDQKDKEKLKSIVITAASNDNYRLIIHLLHQGYQVNVLNDKNQTLTHLAYYSDTHSILQRSEGSVFSSCKNYSNYVDCNGLSHLHVACAAGYVDAVKQFLDNNQDIYARLAAHCNGDRKGFTPLHFAVAHHQIEVIKLLLDRGADINAADSSGITPLHLICAVSWDFQKFMDAESLIKRTSWTTELDILKLLLERDCDVNSRDESGNTPLFSIFKNDYYYCPLKLDEILIRNVYVKEDLVSLLRTRQLEKCIVLFPHGVDISVKNHIDESILHCVIEDLTSKRFSVIPLSKCLHDKAYADLIRLLLEANKGLDVNAKNAKGETPISLAVSLISRDIVEVLLDYDADLSSIKIDGHQFFRHPKVILGLDLVNSLKKTIDILQCKGFELILGDNLTIMKFLAHDVDDCDCGLVCQLPILPTIASQFLCCGSSAHLKRIVTKACESSDNTTKLKLLSCVQLFIEYSKFISYPLLVDEKVLEMMENCMGVQNKQFIMKNLQQCTDDVSLMKSTTFSCGLSVYDFVTKCPRAANIAMFVKSHPKELQIDQLLQRPINGRLIIIGHLAKLTVRMYIESSALKDYVSFILPMLPDLCHRMILGYLDIEDILRLCEAALLE